MFIAELSSRGYHHAYVGVQNQVKLPPWYFVNIYDTLGHAFYLNNRAVQAIVHVTDVQKGNWTASVFFKLCLMARHDEEWNHQTGAVTSSISLLPTSVGPIFSASTDSTLSRLIVLGQKLISTVHLIPGQRSRSIHET